MTKEEILAKLIKRQKTLLAEYNKKGDKEIIGAVEKVGERIALIKADFKCQHPDCTQTERLQFHHLINRAYKEFMDFGRYVNARHYWTNLMVLCAEHHAQIEGRPLKGDEGYQENNTISQKKIDAVKELCQLQTTTTDQILE